jgi:hypothetical protein
MDSGRTRVLDFFMGDPVFVCEVLGYHMDDNEVLCRLRCNDIHSRILES